jgi:hypothetical protein
MILVAFFPAAVILIREIIKLLLHYGKFHETHPLRQKHHFQMLTIVIFLALTFMIFNENLILQNQNRNIFLLRSSQILMVFLGSVVSIFFIQKYFSINYLAKSNDLTDSDVNLRPFDMKIFIEDNKENHSDLQNDEKLEFLEMSNLNFTIKTQVSNIASEIYNILLSKGICKGPINLFEDFINQREPSVANKIEVTVEPNTNKNFLLFINSFFEIPIYTQYKALVSSKIMTQESFNETLLEYLDMYFIRDCSKKDSDIKLKTFMSMKADNLINNSFRHSTSDEIKKYNKLFGI